MFLAKRDTERRVAPKSAPLTRALVADEWWRNGAIPAAALVRSAVFATNFAPLRATGTLTFPSSLWVVTSDFKTWNMTLGLQVRQGVSTDWDVELKLDPSAHTATVRTTHWKTANDALVHAGAHDRLRDELLSMLANGTSGEVDEEARASSFSLESNVKFSYQSPGKLSLQFAIRSNLDERALLDVAKNSGRRVIHETRAGITFGLGLPKHQHGNQVLVRLAPGEITAAANVYSESAVARRIAAKDLHGFVVRVLSLVRVDDPNALYVGPQEWSQ